MGQETFEQLLRRHVDMVYSSALRQVHDPAGAEDVTQAVFILLSKKVHSIPEENIGGWLFMTTRYLSRNLLRAEARRRKHEQRAAQERGNVTSEPTWNDLADQIDAAVAQLGNGERQVVLRQYFQGQTMDQIGTAMGISQAAAKKRASRALDRMRGYLAEKGVQVGSSTLGMLISAHAVQTVPPHVAAAAVSAANGVIGSGASLLVNRALGAKLFALKAGATIMVASAAGVACVVATQNATPKPAPPAPIVSTAPSTAPTSEPVAVLTPPNILGIKCFHLTMAARSSPTNVQSEEGWFDRVKGKVRVTGSGAGQKIEYDDGSSVWTYRKGGKVVGKSKSELPLLEQLRELEMVLAGWVQWGPVEQKGQEATIGGVFCRSYKLTAPRVAKAMDVWADNSNLIRRASLKYDTTMQDIDFEYDPKIEPDVFTKQWPADVQVVDSNELLAKLFPLEGARCKIEGAGMTFAVHELKLGSDGCYQMIYSTRLSDTGQKLLAGNEKPLDHVGDAFVWSYVPKKPSLPRYSESVAEFGDGPVRVQYVLIVPQSPSQPAFGPAFEFSVDITASNELQAALAKAGKPVTQLTTTSVTCSNDRPGTDAFAAQAYNQMLELYPAVECLVWYQVPLRRAIETRHPGEITLDEFKKSLIARRDYWLHPETRPKPPTEGEF